MNHELFQVIKTGKTAEQVICFPYLGGYLNSYFSLAEHMHEDINVLSLHLPGHGVSQGKLLEHIDSVLDLCFDSLMPLLTEEYVFFGHSMGGIIAYFLTKRILESTQYLNKPKSLILSACNFPTEFYNKNFSDLTDEMLLEKLIAYGGIPNELIQEKTILEYFFPIFRADFRILESAAYSASQPLDIPAYFFWGEADKIATLDAAIGWGAYFSQPIKVLPVERGSHLFVRDQAKLISQYIESIIRKTLPES